MGGGGYKHSDNTTCGHALEPVCSVHCGYNPSLVPDDGAFEVSSLNLIPLRIASPELYFYFMPLTFFKLSEINSFLDSISRFLLKIYFKATASHLFRGYLLSSSVLVVLRSHPSLLGCVPWEAELQPEGLGSIPLCLPLDLASGQH